MSSDNGFYSDMPDGSNDNVANSNEEAGASVSNSNNDYQRDNNNNYSSSAGGDRGNRGRHERGSEQGISVLVRNVDDRARKEEVQEFFSRFGEVLDVYLPKNYHTGRPTGFGFISMKTMEDAEKVIQQASNETFFRRKITCELAKEKRKSKDEMAQKSGPSRGGGGRGGDRRDSNRRRSRSRDRRDSKKSGRGRSGEREKTRRGRSGDREKKGGGAKKERSRSPPPRRGDSSDKQRDT